MSVVVIFLNSFSKSSITVAFSSLKDNSWSKYSLSTLNPKEKCPPSFGIFSIKVLSSVDFPLPFAPIIPRVSPLNSSNEVTPNGSLYPNFNSSVFKTSFPLVSLSLKFLVNERVSYLLGLSTISILSICLSLDSAIFAFVGLYLNLSAICLKRFISACWYS